MHIEAMPVDCWFVFNGAIELEAICHFTTSTLLLRIASTMQSCIMYVTFSKLFADLGII